MTFLTLLLACGTAGTTDSADASGAACATVTSADDWAWYGECPQMTTPVDLDVEGCALSLDYAADGGMTMGMPYAGTISGDTVTFEAGDTVTGCVGTVNGADRIEGTCGGGCTFTLRR